MDDDSNEIKVMQTQSGLVASLNGEVSKMVVVAEIFLAQAGTHWFGACKACNWTSGARIFRGTANDDLIEHMREHHAEDH